jgi:Leucine-rich repeat (LRR) protein
MLIPRNLDSLSKSDFAQQIVALKLPRNNLGDQGVAYIFGSERLNHLLRLDLSSNNITAEGAAHIS